MSALPSKTTVIGDIFAPSMFFNIPEYQRPYVWEEDHIKDLLEDVEKAFEQGGNREYFLGCMIWNTKKSEHKGQAYISHDILDGQQRFITLYLLQAVIRDLSNQPQLHETVGERLWQKANPLKALPERHRMEFSIREDDQEFIKEFIIDNGSSLAEEALRKQVQRKDVGTSVRHMSQGLLTMHTWWGDKRKRLADEATFQQYLFDYYMYLSNHVSIIYLATDDNLDDAYNLFTVLNSRGQKLTTSDMLRAKNLGVIKDDQLRKKCATRWEEYQSEVEGQFHSFDDFLWTLADIWIKYRGEVNTSLTKAFDAIYRNGQLHPGKSTVDFIGRYVDHLNALTAGGFGGKEAGCLFTNLNFLLAATHGHGYRILLLYYRECFGENQLLEFLVKVDNLYSVSWLTGSRGIQQRMFGLLRRMEELSKAHPNKAQAAALFLADEALGYEYSDKAATGLDLTAFFDLLDHEEWGSFSGTKINKTRYLLLKLDLILGSRTAEITFDKTVATVEHLLPQKIDPVAWGISAAQHTRWMHRLGNLVLVDMRKNASFGNSPFPVKREKYKVQYANRANTNYVLHSHTDWDLATLKHNHERVLGLLKQYYEGNSLATVLKLWQKTK